MSLMLKSLIVMILSSLAVYGLDVEEKILEFQKKRLPRNIVALDVKILESSALEKPEGWKAYFIKMVITQKEQKNAEKREFYDVVFASQDAIAGDLIDPAHLLSYKKRVHPSVPKDVYRKGHLIAGNHNAPNKVLIFSDPVCPFCMDNVPEVIGFVKKHPKELALYYYHLPLVQIHPAAPAICKAMIAAEMQGAKEVVEKVYAADFDYKERDEHKILSVFNKAVGTKLTLKDISTDKVKNHLNDDIDLSKKLFVTGTPTLFTNGKKDFTRSHFKSLVK